MTTTTTGALVAQIEREMLAAEGPWYVEGIYFASESDAAAVRRWAAERRVREQQRREAEQAREEQGRGVLREMATYQQRVLAETGILVSGWDVVEEAPRRMPA